jgi:hypothetical protein
MHLCFAKPLSRGGGAPRDVRVQRHPFGVRSCVKDARERAYDAGRSPLGAPPWRFWAPGPRFSHRHLRRIGHSELSHPGRNAWAATSRASWGERLRAAPAGRHASLRLQDRLRRRPSRSEAGQSLASLRIVVKKKFILCRQPAVGLACVGSRLPPKRAKSAHCRSICEHCATRF